MQKTTYVAETLGELLKKDKEVREGLSKIIPKDSGRFARM